MRLPYCVLMHEPKLKRTRRHLPHWELPGSTYFVTFRLKCGEMSVAERQIVFRHIRDGDETFYCLYAVVVMPDHVHLLAKPIEGVTLDRMMHGIKGVTARRLNEHCGLKGPVWLGESYDRIVCDEAEAVEKQNYIYENPVRAGLVNRPQEYQFVYRGALW